MRAATKAKGKRAKGKREPVGAPHTGLGLDLPVIQIVLLGLSLLLQSLVFPPIEVWPLAFVCLVPWFLVTALSRNATAAYLTSYVLGLAFFLINLRWLSVVTVEGYVALSAYLAVYYPLVACPVRHAVRRRGLPLALVAPVVWTASELCRAVVVSGFPWFFLGHTQYRVLSLIQVSDLVGAYGVSFLVVAVNGAVADAILRRLSKSSASGLPPRAARGSVIFAAGLLLFALVYGQIQLHRDTSSPGPRIAVLQQDYLNFADPEVSSRQPTSRERAAAYDALLQQAAAEHPDLFLLPETPWFMALNPEYLQYPGTSPDSVSHVSQDMLRRHAVGNGAYLVTGAMTIIPTPYSLRTEDIKHNSAFIFAPDGSPPQRYDKIHCVYFGETVPFRYGRLRFLYWWLNEWVNERTALGEGYYEHSLTPGTEFKVFAMRGRSQPDREFHFAVPICYEDVMPYVSRRFVTDPQTGAKRVDLLLNISNDGWFGHSNEHPQHLAICAFRAVENRVPIARAVNTGISGFIEASGRIHDLVTTDGRSRGPGVTGYAAATVQIDRRHSLYSRVGDLFAIVCGLLTLLTYVDYVIVRAVGARQNGPPLERGG